MATNFGRDISCLDSLRPGVFVSGARLVAEACYRRLTTPRGMLRGGEAEASYGLDLTNFVGSTTARADIASLEGRIRNELLKDERVSSVGVTIVVETTGPAKSLKIAINAATANGPFTLQVKVTEVTVKLLGIEV
jgi:hypothetical protein